MPVDPYASHIAVLAAVIQGTEGPVLECGAGVYSTPLLHALCAARARELVTIETNATWAKELSSFFIGTHRLVSPQKLADEPMLRRAWDVAFVDNGQFEREPCIRALANVARFIVVHDTEHPELYGYEPLLSQFKHRIVIVSRPWKVTTSVVSNLAAIDWLKGILP